MHAKKLGPDLVKFVAIFSVIGVHFILNTMDSVRISGTRAEFSYFFYRQIFIVCVPLFMLTTGYLNYKQSITNNYYKKLIPIIGTYLLYSILSLMFRMWVLGETISILESIYLILNFKASPYNWYVNMYIGLFLLSPLINKFAVGVSQKQFQWLLFSLMVLTIFPITLNVFPSLLFDQSGIVLPNFWVTLYPVTYYMSGIYLRHYPLKKKLGWTIAVTAFLSVIISIFFSADGNLSQVTKDYGNLFTFIQSISVFSLLVNYQNEALQKNRFLQFVARHTLEIYLISFISDQMVYRAGSSLLTQTYRDFLYAPLFVVASFLLAILLVKLIKMASSLLQG